MDFQSLIPLIEGLLFASSEPLTTEKIAKIVEVDEDLAFQGLIALQKDLEENKRGIKLISKDKEWLLVTNEKVSPYAEKLRKEVFEGELSSASKETLAIIAYEGPVSRAKINEIRGVDSYYILHQLLLRGLIERMPDQKRANAFLYQISFEFLKYLGLKNVNELPHYNEIKQKDEINNQKRQTI
ncbi:MAG TPA: SMC-Scp complex subunit ScpB [Candidatus Paceibacterota bacterium]|nr:SMC-Scp complex subunit ScpB [Candidatus Paceibacterota bacterium]